MGRASEIRREQVKSLLISTLSEIIRSELTDPRIGMFSIMDLRLSSDLSFAEVSLAVVGGRDATDASVAVLNAAAPLIRNRLRDATDLRLVPQLRFKADHSGEYLDEIENLLKTIPRPSAAAPDLEVVEPASELPVGETPDEQSKEH